MERQGDMAGEDNVTGPKKATRTTTTKTTAAAAAAGAKFRRGDTRCFKKKDDEVFKTANFRERKKQIKNKRDIQQGLKV